MEQLPDDYLIAQAERTGYPWWMEEQDADEEGG